MRNDPKIEIIRDKDGTESFWLKIKDAEPDEAADVKAHYDALERVAKTPDRIDKLEKKVQELLHVVAYMLDALKYHVRNNSDVGDISREKLDIANRRLLKLITAKYEIPRSEPEGLNKS